MAKKSSIAELRREIDRLRKETVNLEHDWETKVRTIAELERNLEVSRTHRDSLAREMCEIRTLVEYMARHIGGAGAGVQIVQPRNLEPE